MKWTLLFALLGMCWGAKDIKIACRGHPEIRDGRVIDAKSRYTPGEAAQVTCYPGYKPESSDGSYILCSSEGVWNTTHAHCIGISCQGHPGPRIKNGRVIDGKWLYISEEAAPVTCDPGYKPETSAGSYILCSSEGVWITTHAHCIEDAPIIQNEESDVPLPQFCVIPDVENGRTVPDAGAVSPGESLDVECLPGYKAEDGAGLHLLCMDDGKFDDPFPVCSVVHCLPPETPEHGQVNFGPLVNAMNPVFLFGSEISYSCEVDFRLVGPELRWCDAEGWTGVEPHCQAISCAAQPEIRNGRVVDGKLRYMPEEAAQVTCDLGYMPETGDGSYIKCSAEGVWNTTHAHCVELMCDPPVAPANGLVESTATFYGFMDKVTYACQLGFTLVGKKVHFCREKGWSDPAPTCREVRCPRPSVPDGAWIEGEGEGFKQDSYPEGQILTLKCPDWYRLLGTSRRTCTERGWTGVPIECKLRGCPSPKPSEGSRVMFQIRSAWNQVKSNFFGFGNSLITKCPEGFRKNVKAEPVCQRNGKWSSSIPDCVEIFCESPSQLPNSFIVATHGMRGANYPFGSRIRYACIPGYTLKGLAVQSCTANRWSGYPPYCQEVVCNEPFVSNGRIRYQQIWSQSRRVNSTFEVICNEGYRSVDDRHIVRCKVDGQWNDTMNKCHEVRCNPPTELPNGWLVGEKEETYAVGSQVTYQCRGGFKLHPLDGFLSCTSNGFWDDAALSCEEAECWIPNFPSNGSFTIESYADLSEDASLVPVGTTLNFQCAQSFKLNGEPTIKCLDTGMWSEETPQCEAPYCSKPVVERAYPVGGHFRYQTGHLLTVQCLPGFFVKGNGTLQCTADGEWTPSALQCQEVLCLPPPVPAFGQVNPKKSYYVYGDTISYRCLNPSLRLRGQREQECGAAGWSGTVPICAVVKNTTTCAPPSTEMENSRLYLQVPPRKREFGIGDRITVLCGKGFKPSCADENYVICTPNGTWSTEFVTCIEAEEIPCLPPPTEVSNGLVLSPKDAYLAGDYVAVACHPGFRPRNDTYFLTCKENGQWDQDLTQCEAVWCDAPVPPANGTVEKDPGDLEEGDPWPFHSEANFLCRPGFQLVGHHWVKCLQNGWSSATPQCREIVCDDPGTPDDGFKKGDVFTVGARVHFGCFSGYALVGPKERICLTNGQWSQNQPYCQAAEMKDCPELAAPTSGFKKVSHLDGQVTFTCPPGYSLIGSRTRSCLTNGTWSGSLAQCVGKHQFDNKDDVSKSVQLLLKDLSEEQDVILRALPKKGALQNDPPRDQKKSPQHLVVYFVIDASSSIGNRNFQRAKLFARAVIEKLDISRMATRVGLVTFSTRATAEFYPTDFHSAHNILAALEAALYTEGGTSLQAALEILQDVMAETEQSLEGGVAKSHVFLLTDGKFNAGTNPGGIAKRLKERFAARFTCVALTGHWRKEVLYSIASDPGQVFFLHSFVTLEWLAQQVKNRTLDFSRCGQDLDRLTQLDTAKRSGFESVDAISPWPWTVFINLQKKQICKGSLISADWILTSAWCVLGRKGLLKPNQLSIELGLQDRSLQVSEIHVHADFNISTKGYNVALLRLTSPVIFNQGVQPICLPSGPQNGSSSLYKPGEYAYASSWSAKEQPGRRLRHLALHLQPRANCLAALLSNDTFCAGDGNEQPSGSNGDNGGPLIQFQLDRAGEPVWVQVGITSFQLNSMYSYYTDVSQLMDWVRLLVSNQRL